MWRTGFRWAAHGRSPASGERVSGGTSDRGIERISTPKAPHDPMIRRAAGALPRTLQRSFDPILSPGPRRLRAGTTPPQTRSRSRCDAAPATGRAGFRHQPDRVATVPPTDDHPVDSARHPRRSRTTLCGHRQRWNRSGSVEPRPTGHGATQNAPPGPPLSASWPARAALPHMTVARRPRLAVIATGRDAFSLRLPRSSSQASARRRRLSIRFRTSARGGPVRPPRRRTAPARDRLDGSARGSA